MAAASRQLVIRDAEFVFGAPDAESIPQRQHLPEVAIVGRSNVGKSSFVNRILGRTIARVSSTPGCTRQLNFFRVNGEFKERRIHLALVDLPGFGFAKLSKREREGISRTVVTYLRQRSQLQVLIILNDCRRLPEDDELAVQRMCAEEGIACIVVVTKFDVLRQSERVRSLADIAKAYRLEPGDIIAAGKDLSIDPVWDRITQLVEDRPPSE